MPKTARSRAWRMCALLALLALVTNDQLRHQRPASSPTTSFVTNDQLRLAPTDGAPLMLAIAIAAGHHLELRCAPSRASAPYRACAR